MDGFVAIIEAGSIAAAARSLRIPRATLSRQLKRLESELELRLIHRSTRRLVPTPAGQELYARARRIVADTREAEEALRRLDGVPRGLLRVSVPGGPEFIGPLIAGFLRRYPEVRLEIINSTVHEDLIGRAIDVALRAGTFIDGSLIARVLRRDRVLAVASPTYIDRAGLPAAAAELIDHDCIVGFGGTDHPNTSWPLLDGGEVTVRGLHAATDLPTQIYLAAEGFGIAMCPMGFVRSRMAKGELVSVLEDDVGTETTVALVYPDREFLDPKVRAFIDYIIEATADLNWDQLQEPEVS
ncbi:MAG: LysR family transcriptional regulator [Proteobacteria bacterium]|nr:LysR family transcriptional regulator [Pseudomonadota bacterium]